MLRARIIAHGTCLPDGVLTNEFFVKNNPYKVYLGEDEHGEPVFRDKLVELSYEDIEKKTGGIKERRKVAESESVEDLVERAFHSTAFPADELHGAVIATCTDERNVPSLACKVCSRINARNVSNAFDVNAACSGFTHALYLAAREADERKTNWLVAGVETLTRMVDYEEINANLFGDGCGCVVIGPAREQSGEGILSWVFKNKIEGARFIYKDKHGKLRMPQGRKVFEYAVKGMVEIARELGARGGFDAEEVGLVIPHQANGRIIDSVEQRVKQFYPRARVYRTIEKYGNMSSATVPIALSEAIQQGALERGEVVLLLDIGAGLALGGLAIRY